MKADTRLVWRKSSYSNTEMACVEVAALAGRIGVRDSKNPQGPRLALPVVSFADLVARVKRDELNL